MSNKTPLVAIGLLAVAAAGGAVLLMGSPDTGEMPETATEVAEAPKAPTPEELAERSRALEEAPGEIVGYTTTNKGTKVAIKKLDQPPPFVMEERRKMAEDPRYARQKMVEQVGTRTVRMFQGSAERILKNSEGTPWEEDFASLFEDYEARAQKIADDAYADEGTSYTEARGQLEDLHRELYDEAYDLAGQYGDGKAEAILDDSLKAPPEPKPQLSPEELDAALEGWGEPWPPADWGE